MIKTGIALIVLIVATIWLPVWAQIALYIIAVILVRHRLLIFIPAVFADTLYTPTTIWHLSAHRYVILVAVLLIGFYLVITKTRIGQLYAMEK